MALEGLFMWPSKKWGKTHWLDRGFQGPSEVWLKTNSGPVCPLGFTVDRALCVTPPHPTAPHKSMPQRTRQGGSGVNFPRPTHSLLQSRISQHLITGSCPHHQCIKSLTSFFHLSLSLPAQSPPGLTLPCNACLPTSWCRSAKWVVITSMARQSQQAKPN